MPEKQLRILLDKIAKDDEKALRQLHVHFYERLCKFALHLLKSEELSEEAVSDVFFQCWQVRKRLGSVRHPTAYLYMAVRNQALQYIRQGRTNLVAPDPDFMLQWVDDGNTDDQLLSAELQDALQAAIRQLPERCRQVFKLIREDELSYKETAEVLNIAVKTVEAQMRIASQKLEKILKAYLT